MKKNPRYQSTACSQEKKTSKKLYTRRSSSPPLEYNKGVSNNMK